MSRVGYSCTCAPLFRISETAGRIALKFGTYAVRDPLVKRFTESPIMLIVGDTCTCARAHPLTVSREQLDRLPWKLVCC